MINNDNKEENKISHNTRIVIIIIRWRNNNRRQNRRLKLTNINVVNGRFVWRRVTYTLRRQFGQRKNDVNASN